MYLRALLVWKKLPNYQGYEISSKGEVRAWYNTHRELRTIPRMLKCAPDKDGYLVVSLRQDQTQKQRLVHRLVLEAFVGPCPEGMECRHLNGVRNDNRVENLRWGTSKENRADCVEHGTIPRGERSPNAKLKTADIPKIRALLTAQMDERLIARRFKVSRSTISKVKHGRSWRHV